jgi:UTP--glucose-1-phosphate uridylyltransferase
MEVADLVEKPAADSVPSRLAVAARYVIGPSVFAALRDTEPDAGGEIQLTAALRTVLEAGEPVIAVRLAAGERRHDIGSLEGYCVAVLEYALTHPTLGASLRETTLGLLERDGPG